MKITIPTMPLHFPSAAEAIIASTELQPYQREAIAAIEAGNVNRVYGKSGLPNRQMEMYASFFADQGVDVTELPRGGKMIGPATADQLRAYITRDIEATEALRKRVEIEHAIAEGWRLQHLGRPSKPAKPTLISLHVFAVLNHWSNYK